MNVKHSPKANFLVHGLFGLEEKIAPANSKIWRLRKQSKYKVVFNQGAFKFLLYKYN